MTTPKLGLGEMQASQSQPHIVFNTAVRALEAALQISVISADETVAPGSPAEGQYYIVGDTATGTWAGHDADVAYVSGGTWKFITPVIGWIAYNQYNDEYLSFDGAGWAVLALSGSPGGGGDEGHAPFHDLAIAAGVITLDLDNYGEFNVNLSANVTSVLYSGILSGDVFRFRLRIHQDATGGRTFAVPGSWKYPSGVSAYTVSSGADDTDLVEGVSFNGGDTWLISYEKDYA